MPTSSKSPRKRSQGETTTVVGQKPSPRLPHERDESIARGPQQAPDASMRQAHADVKRGLPDTDRGPVVDEVYRKLKK